MAPAARKNKSKPELSNALEEDASKPKLFSIFHKKPMHGPKPTLMDDSSSEMSRIASSSSNAPTISMESTFSTSDDIIEVSSPPNEPTDALCFPSASMDVHLDPDPNLRSIFDLPVPKLPNRQVSSSSLRSKNSNASLKDFFIPKDKKGVNTPAPLLSQPGVVLETEPVLSLPSSSTLESSQRPFKRKASRQSNPTLKPSKPSLSRPTSSKSLFPLFSQTKQHGSSLDSPVTLVDLEVSEGETLENPIVLSSPTKEPKSLPPPGIRKRNGPSTAPPSWPSSSSQHVRGPQTTFTNQPTHSQLFPARPHISHNLSPGQAWVVPSSCTTAPRKAPRHLVMQPSIDLPAKQDVLSTIPSDHLAKPAFRRLEAALDDEHGTDSPEMWSERWKPRKADQVLGNEDHAGFLKAWLEALEIDAPSVNALASQQTSSTSSPPPDLPSFPPVPIKAKRAAIIRAVAKPDRGAKRRKVGHSGYGSDDWIVSDEESNMEEDTHNLTNYSSPWDPASSPPAANTADAQEPTRGNWTFSPLTNVILLTGPSGSGKTAAVYACAEELGWEVHEIYAGMGKRSGPNLTALLEGVSKNHVLGKGGVGETSATSLTRRGEQESSVRKTLTSFFKTDFLAQRDVPVDEEPLVLDSPRKDGRLSFLRNVRDDVVTDREGQQGLRSTARQSLILLEEVDILFAKDQNFWSSVVSIVADSQRPVVLTCNDPELEQLSQLPLQARLSFKIPPQAVLSSYLRLLGLVNGRHISEETAERIVTSSRYHPISADVPDHPVHPLPYQQAPSLDLRRSINELQFVSRICSISPHDLDGYQDLRTMYIDRWNELEETLCDWNTGMGEDDTARGNLATPEEDDIHALSRFVDVVSVVDSHINRRPAWKLEALAIDRYHPTPDDEVGYLHLQKPDVELSSGPAFYQKDEEMAVETLFLARQHLKEMDVSGFGGGWGLEGKRLFEARASYQQGIVQFLDEMISLSTPLLPRPAAVMDYLAYIQKMVEVDDTLALHMEPRVGRRGILRQSSRLAHQPRVYERWIGLRDDSLHAVRVSRLGVD